MADSKPRLLRFVRDQGSQRKALTRLRRMGLYSGKKRRIPTRYAKSLIRKYASVLTGDARAVKVPSIREARKFKALGYETKGRRVLVDTPESGTRFRWTRKGIIRIATVEGKPVKTRIPSTIGLRPGIYWLVTRHFRQEIGDENRAAALIEEYKAKGWTDVAAFVELQS